MANMISSLGAASLVFLVSRGRVFASAQGFAPARLAIYLAYTALLVTIASFTIGALARPIADEARSLGLANAPALAAVLAKVIVTPAQLALNFLMASRLNGPAPTRAEAAHA
jgi:hypothetical protein